jgi:hypothetical protein
MMSHVFDTNKDQYTVGRYVHVEQQWLCMFVTALIFVQKLKCSMSTLWRINILIVKRDTHQEFYFVDIIQCSPLKDKQRFG